MTIPVVHHMAISEVGTDGGIYLSSRGRLYCAQSYPPSSHLVRTPVTVRPQILRVPIVDVVGGSIALKKLTLGD
jgi:hypothetical protein